MKFIIVLLSLVSVASAVVRDPIDEIVAKVTSRAFESDLSQITPSNEAAVMAKLRQVAYGTRSFTMLGTAMVDRDNARVILIRLGDGPTIEKVVSNFERYDSPSAVGHVPDLLVGARQPLVIPALARSLFVSDGATKSVVFEEDVVAPRRSTYAGVLVTRIIRRCPEFTPHLQAWAAEMQELRGSDPKRFGEVMRTWWQQNADAFQRREFAAVQPLSDPSLASPARPQQMTVPETSPAASAAVATPSPPVPVVSSATPPSLLLWTVAATAVAVLVGLLFFLKRRA